MSPARAQQASNLVQTPNSNIHVPDPSTNVLLAGFGTDRLRCEQAMKPLTGENPNHWAIVPGNRDHGAAGQNRSRSIEWAAKQERFRPWERFFVTVQLPVAGELNCYEAFVHDATRMARFEREAKLLAALNHPNIAAIYGLEESNTAHAPCVALITEVPLQAALHALRRPPLRN